MIAKLSVLNDVHIVELYYFPTEVKIINCITPGTSLCNNLFKFLAVAPILQDDIIYLDRLSASELCVNWHSPINRGEYILLHYEVTLSGFPLRTIENDMRTCYDSLISGSSYRFNLTVVTACSKVTTRIYKIELGEIIVSTSESTAVSASTSESTTVSASASESTTVSASASESTVSTSTSKFFHYILVKKAC